MARTDAPRPVRLAARLTMAVAPVGLLLLLDGLLELHWLGTPEAHRLVALMERLRAETGMEPSTLLRGWSGAVEDVLIGLVCIGLGALGIWVLRGRAWARTWALILGILVTLVGVAAIGADEADPNKLDASFAESLSTELGIGLPIVRGLVYPGWFTWFEDIVQALQVIVSLVAVLALAWAVITCSGYFNGMRDADAPPDDWDVALARAKEQPPKRYETES
jgi:hypothetical protein